MLGPFCALSNFLSKMIFAYSDPTFASNRESFNERRKIWTNNENDKYSNQQMPPSRSEPDIDNKSQNRKSLWSSEDNENEERLSSWGESSTRNRERERFSSGDSGRGTAGSRGFSSVMGDRGAKSTGKKGGGNSMRKEEPVYWEQIHHGYGPSSSNVQGK